jgi:crossover junction endodeoxyribonuclease RuvC
MRVLGIDPGYGRCGVAVVEKSTGVESLLYSNCIETEVTLSFSERMREVANGVLGLISSYSPDVIAIEEVYFSKNQKTVLHVAEIRGMLLYLAVSNHIPVEEYNPLRIKVAMTGYGKATKDQVIQMIERLVKPEKTITHDDEYDAIAVALTHIAETRSHKNIA